MHTSEPRSVPAAARRYYPPPNRCRPPCPSRFSGARLLHDFRTRLGFPPTEGGQESLLKSLGRSATLEHAIVRLLVDNSNRSFGRSDRLRAILTKTHGSFARTELRHTRSFTASTQHVSECNTLEFCTSGVGPPNAVRPVVCWGVVSGDAIPLHSTVEAIWMSRIDCEATVMRSVKSGVGECPASPAGH